MLFYILNIILIILSYEDEDWLKYIKKNKIDLIDK